jgi:tetratricopeptide (TPR) repeat protein
VLSGNEAIIANQVSGFDGLRLEVQRLARLFRSRNQQAGNQETQVVRNLEQCVQSAGQFVSSASTIMGARTTIAGGSELGGLSAPQRIRITNWIPDAPSTIDDGEHDTYATSSTFSQIDAFTDDTATVYRDVGTTNRSVVEELPRRVTNGPDPAIVAHLIQFWKKSAKTKFDAGDYAAAEIYLTKVIKRSEAIHGARFEGKAEIVQSLVLALSRQGKWDETHALLHEKFHGREETMEQIAADCLEQCNWEQAEKILLDIWNTEPTDSSRNMRLKQAFAEVCVGKKDYPNAEKWCHQAASEIMANVGMKDPLFFKAIYLLAEVYKASGDIEEMEAYRALLPPEFICIIP